MGDMPDNEVIREQIRAEVEKQFPPDVDEKYKKQLEDISYKVLAQGMTRAEAMGLDQAKIEIAYADAYTKFRSGKYKEAIQIFGSLANICPEDARFPFAAAACYHHQKKYEEAAGYYLICTRIEPDNPIPYFHLFDCFMQQDQLETAWWMIHCTINLSGDDPLFAEMKTRAELEEKHLASLVMQPDRMEKRRQLIPKEYLYGENL